MSAQNGLACEVQALQRELQAFDLGPHTEASDAVLALVRAARRISRLAHQVARDPGGAAAARDEVSLARVTDACLGDESAGVEQGDLEAAIALIAKRLGPPAAGMAVEMSRGRRTLTAIATLPGLSAGE
jgi:hypothetical protein